MADINLGQKLNEVIQSATLIDISLKSCRSELHVPARTVEPKNIELHIERETQHLLSDDKLLLVCFPSLTIKGNSKAPAESQKEYFEISATYTLVYRLENAELNSEAIELFSSQNSYYNAYPYLREIVQNFCIRMNIEPVRLPLLKPLTKKELSANQNLKLENK
jgi:preprotein translocase subunit SecB